MPDEILHYLDPRCEPDHPEFDDDTKHGCPGCDKEVYNARIRAMKGERRCIKCTDTQPYLGCMNYGHKTGGVLMKTQNREHFRLIRKPIDQQR